MDELTGRLEDVLATHEGVMLKFAHMSESERVSLMERARLMRPNGRRRDW
jgi:hypothetical protein